MDVSNGERFNQLLDMIDPARVLGKDGILFRRIIIQ